MNIELIKGDLLKSTCKYIAHQCNCISTYSAGLAKAIFEKYPYADDYSKRFTYKDTLGSIKIKGDDDKLRYVINMFAQYYPGRPKPPMDSSIKRLEAFEECLRKIEVIENLESIGFPYKIGCGLAGGNWNLYREKLELFSNRVNARVVIYEK